MTKIEPFATLEQADRELALGAAEVRDTLPMRVLGGLSDIADQPQLATLCTLVALAGAVRSDRKLFRTGLQMLAGFTVATGCKVTIKRAVDRTRPAFAAEMGYARGRAEHDEGPWNSFPSGHTAGAVAVAQSVARNYPALRQPALGAAAAIAVIQVPRGKHYLTDVLAGALLGWAVEQAVNRVARAFA